MKIYFTAAVSAKSEYGIFYERIVKKLRGLGHDVYADHILGATLTDILGKSGVVHKEYYNKMLGRIRQSDLVVAEVSFPSTVNVGHELTIALEKGKPVIAMHLKGKKPVLFWGLESDSFYVAEYDTKDLEEVIASAMEKLKNEVDTRFNFFINRRVAAYLDWIAAKKRIPRAVYLRQLIRQEMRSRNEFQRMLG